MINLVHAQTAVANAQSFVDQINQIILFPLIALLSVIALLIFIYGGFEYVSGANNPTARENGRKHLVWGTVGLLVMVSAYAILTVAANTINVDVGEKERGVVDTTLFQ